MSMQKPQGGQLGHTCIRVKNVDATVKFYNGLLGMPIVETREKMAALGSQANYLEVFELREGQSIEDHDPATLKLNHICLWVEGLEELEKRAQAAGSPFTQAIRSTDNWVGAALKVSWIVDPDGNRVELLEWTGPAKVS